MKDYSKFTYQGYPIVDQFYDPRGRLCVIVKRDFQAGCYVTNDFAVFKDYNIETGRHKYGIIGFDTKAEAQSFAREDFRYKTAKGHPIMRTFETVYGQTVIVAKRRQDNFLIGQDYNQWDGTWGQGIYDFSSEEEAVKYIQKNLLI